MKPRFFFWTAFLVAVLSVSSCAPAVISQPAAAPTQTLIALATATATLPPDISTPDTLTLTNTPVPTIQAIATSRGPNLEATDPSTVSLASGGPQLIEFFRFT